MQEDKDKLDHLHSCQVSEISSSLKSLICIILNTIIIIITSSSSSPLPPEVLLQAGSTGGQEVVEVHHHVHAGVQERSKPALAATNKSEIIRTFSFVERGKMTMGFLSWSKSCDICRLFYLLRKMNSPGIRCIY